MGKLAIASRARCFSRCCLSRAAINILIVRPITSVRATTKGVSSVVRKRLIVKPLVPRRQNVGAVVTGQFASVQKNGGNVTDQEGKRNMSKLCRVTEGIWNQGACV